jgi:hypothetical protein
MVVARLRKHVVGIPFAPDPGLLARFPALARVRWRRGGLLPRVGGWFLGASSVAAITLWRTVWICERVYATEELLLHELRHVQQFEEVPLFPVRYVWESVRRGYLANRFEVEARQFAATSIRRAGNEPPREDV